MTEKRFTIEIWQEGSLFYKDDKEDFSTHNSTSYVTNLVENKLNKLSDENEQLKREKERYKRLSEIRDENINNRILSLKEFINNCEDEKVRNTLKDLFYSEVKEYDLAKENRKLKRENEQLKKENKHLRCTIESNSQDDYIDYLEKQNERLKERITELATNDKIVFMQ